jgi:hypothetical protein
VSQTLLFPDPKPLVERLGRKFFRRLPERAGVYKMHDAQDRIVYVGKAKNLRQRLASYRIANPEKMPRRHLRMLREVVRIEVELRPTEASALKHEAKLIRELKPRFNRAGVWQGQPKFLAWRFDPPAIEFAIQETPLPGWGRVGPLGAWAPRLRSALVRLLWLAFQPRAGSSEQPARGYADLPRGWAKGELPATVRLDCGNRLEDVRTAMQNLFWARPDAFALWLHTRLPERLTGFDRAAMLADWETFQEFADSQLRRNDRVRDSGQMPLL